MEFAHVQDLHGHGYEHVHEDVQYAEEILQSCCKNPKYVKFEGLIGQVPYTKI